MYSNYHRFFTLTYNLTGNVETGQKLHSFPGSRRNIKDFEGHIGEVYALSISSDGKYLASGGKDQLIHIWDVQENKLLDSFKGHRDTVTVRINVFICISNL